MTMGVDSISKDVRTGLWRQKALGFNAIRLPFTFDILTRPAIIMPGVCNVASWQTVIDSVFPPGVPSKPVPFNPPGIWGGRLPLLNDLTRRHPSCAMYVAKAVLVRTSHGSRAVAYTEPVSSVHIGGVCNAGMPIDTAWNQYLWTGAVVVCLKVLHPLQ